MFEEVSFNINQKKSLMEIINILRENNITGKILLLNDFLKINMDKNISTLYKTKNGALLFLINVPEKDYKKAVDISKIENVLFSLTPIDIVKNNSAFFNKKGLIYDF